MALHVGDVSSQVEIQGQPGGAGGGGAGGSGGGSSQPSWDERQRHRRLIEDERRERERVAGRGFDG